MLRTPTKAAQEKDRDNKRQQRPPALDLVLRHQRLDLRHGGGVVHPRRRPHDDAVGPLGQGEEIAEGRLGQEHAALIDALTDRAEHADHVVARIAQRQLVARPDARVEADVLIARVAEPLA